MKLDLSESRPGEFDALSEEEIRARARVALEAALGQLSGADRLVKGMRPPRGGEMQVVEDLAQLIGDAYAKRMKRLQADVEEILRGAP